MDALTAELDRRLSAACPTGSGNCFTAIDLRRWVVEDLQRYDAELARFPKLVGQPHWNLWMMDGDPGDALFAVLVFRPDGLEFFAGTGEPAAVREWSENTLTHPDGIRAEAEQMFLITGASLRVDRGTAEPWLGRGW